MAADVIVTQLVVYTLGIHAVIPKGSFVGSQYDKKNGLLQCADDLGVKPRNGRTDQVPSNGYPLSPEAAPRGERPPPPERMWAVQELASARLRAGDANIFCTRRLLTLKRLQFVADSVTNDFI